MAIIDLVKWNAPADVYAWKFPSEELSTWTQLIVSESQEAVFLKEGRMIGPFRAGRHTLDTANFPFLTKLVHIPMGGRSPFTAEVWFINRSIALDVKWGTQDPIQLQDPKYTIMLPVRAFGQYGVRIENSSKFLQKLVGTVGAFDRSQLTSYFRGLILTRVKTLIAQYLVRDKISILEISAHLNQLSDLLREQMQPELESFGLRLVNFFVSSVNTPENDPAVARLKEALARRAEMSIIGYTYQQERSFDMMETAAGNQGGTQSTLLGAGMGLGMGVGIANAMGPALGQITPNLQPSGQTCPRCSMANPANARFCVGCATPMGDPAGDAIACQRCGAKTAKPAKCCSSCGRQFNACEKCKSDNPDSATRCVNCASPMPLPCPKCRVAAAPGVRFCPNCGQGLIPQCSECGKDLPGGTKFCPHCGKPAQES